MQLDTGFSCNSVIWLTSLPDSELGPTRRMVEDMASLTAQISVVFQHVQITSAAHLKSFLGELSYNASENGMRPLLHFDMHGGKDNGLHISQSFEYCSWDELYCSLQVLNQATGNNLVVIGAACFGLRSIMPIKLDKPSPFFVLLAPEEEVCVGFLEDNAVCFYRELFASRNLDAAYSRYLSDEFKYFHCEKMLFIVIAKYIRAGCEGKSAQGRRERLLTEVFSQGMEKTEDNLRSVRKKIKEGLKPDQALLDRYVKTFLVGRTCSFSMQQLLSFLESDKP
ncbi:hypothetical protein YA0002_10195 [Pseudomonas cichorii]|uniref:hypothetical protein n=1 Tax=Pseudomonas cichorii TaxID=36746 RepID=UPI0018E63825|nr:hypothetical protein [Pseudomonas cichorii]MBI6853136.1 hypothetical protein [Pseudomonas cichorii]